MTISKNIKKVVLILILAVFALGQIPTLILTLVNSSYHVFQLIDGLVFVYVLMSLFEAKLINRLLQSFVPKLLILFILELIFAKIFLSLGSNVAVLYLLRFFTYLSFGYILYIEKPLTRNEFISFVTASSLFISLTGIFQFLFMPDTRALQYLGWDDHYFRLIGVYLDPAFTGILLVLFFITLLFIWKPKETKYKLIVELIILISILLTYSRASYLSLGAGLFVYFLQFKRSLLKFITVIFIFAFVLLLLPRPSSAGVQLERTFSIFLRINNYKETINIWKTSPLLGVGYNNLCEAKNVKNTISETISHSCSGADNSLLFFLSTTGIIGIVSMFVIFRKFGKLNMFISAILFSLITHSFFTNTLVYPWVMAYVALVVATKKNLKD